MPQPCFRIVLACLFCLVLFAESAFARLFSVPDKCPYPTYVGCRRGATDERPYILDFVQNDGLNLTGGGYVSGTDPFP